MGGGGNDDYEAQQAALEAKRQQARDALNVIFGVSPTAGQTVPVRTIGPDGTPYESPQEAVSSQANANKAARDALYQKVRTDAFDAGKRRFDEDKTRAARDNKFALFAQGLNGGSVDVDENALLSRTYGQGLLDLGAKADTAKNDMLSSDEQTRLGLLQSIDNGMDQGSALSSALAQMNVNSQRAASEAQGTTLGDLFGDAGLLYTKSNAARGKSDAEKYWSSQYPTGMPRASSKGASTGIITSTGG